MENRETNLLRPLTASLVHVVTVALMANHALIRLKRFVSSCISKLCNLFYFLTTFNAPYMCLKVRQKILGEIFF